MTAALEGGEWPAAHPNHTLPPGKTPLPIVQDAGWAPGPVWTGAENLAPTVCKNCIVISIQLSYKNVNDMFIFISDDNDVVSNYFSRKGKKYGLLSLFNYAKDSVLPQRSKKSF
jgi:hypothetical protein